MSLENDVMSLLKDAMKNKDEALLRGLRAIKAEIIKAKTEPGANGAISAETELKLLQKLVKQRKDSLTIFEQQNRADLAVKESEEIAVIEKFLPAQMSEEAVKAAEPTLTDINAKLDAIMAMLTADAVSDVVEEPMAAKVEETNLSEPEVKAEEVKAEEPAEKVEAEAKIEEVKPEAPVANEAAALKAELSAKVIELEASRGIKPIEVETSKQLSRVELLAQFNAEKNPSRAAEIFKQIKFAR
jgi:uncharacterized protein YqeY